ncbi:T9SS type B sorting domain-containing protein [Cyclobacterium plantarum]|uniref:T9SS type B sorting domain-containing protein n=1 Tax=Cyclobacterium plantarum TaxID=2716263 RepID=A0ABX0H664_9BACT|nr:gliding motility-associated C-terminal domain-containing protein [Cyclobacterium plantarum]NHE57360.1 T9SS type B sorting domain-containing protein [Cyclobacterium plantarum]
MLYTTLVVVLTSTVLLQTQGKDWMLFLPITVTGQEEVKIFYDEGLVITLDMLTIDYDGDPGDLSLQVLEGPGYNRTGNTINRTIEYDKEWSAAGEEILVNVRVSDVSGDFDDYELRILVIPPLTHTRYDEKPCMGIVTLEVKAYQPFPGIPSQSFPVNFTLLDLDGNIIQEQIFTSSFPGQGTASASFDFEELDLSRIANYDIIVEDNLGRVFTKQIGPLGEPYSINFDINVSGPLCAEDPGGVVEFIFYNAEVPLTSFIIYDEEDNIVSDTYNIVSLTTDYLVINSDNIGNGKFTMEVIDRLGCSGTEEFEIVLPEPIIVEESIQNLSCFGANDGEIVLSISGGWSQPFEGSPFETARNYSIHWFALSGDKIGTESNIPIEKDGEILGMESTLSNLPEGSYYAVIQESVRRFEIPDAAPLLCTIVTPTFIVEGPDPLELNANFNPISCNGAGDGIVTIAPTGGTEAYTIAWYEGNFADLTVPDPTGLNELTAQAGDDAMQRQGLEAGDYAVLLTDANGCMIAENFTIEEPDPLSMIERADLRVDVQCFGEETGLIVLEVDGPTTGPYFFEAFRDGASEGIKEDPIVSLGFGEVFISDLPAGNYRLVVTDAKGCTFEINDILIDQPDTGLIIEEPVISDYNGFQISCPGQNDGSIELEITGGEGALDYLWTGPDGFESTEKDIFDLAPGQYQFIVTDENNCTATIGSVELIAPTPITLNEVIPNYNGFEISCTGSADGSINPDPAGGTGAFTFSWAGPDGFSFTDPIIENLSPGSYELTITDSNGCILESSYLLEEPVELIIEEIPDERVNITCFGDDTGAIAIALTSLSVPPYEIQLGEMGETVPLRTINDFVSDRLDLANLVAGNYWVRVTDSNGCSKIIEDIPIVQPENGLELTNVSVSDYNGFEISCNGANDGFISFEVEGAQGAVALSWSGPDGFTSASNTLSDLAPGNYELTVSDESGCSLTETFGITEPEALSLTDEVSDFNGFGIQCNGGNEGFIHLLISGGNEPINVNWTGPDGFTSNDTSLENLVTGVYEVLISDQNGCQINSSYNLTEPESLQIVELVDEKENVACFGQETGRLGVSLSGPSAGPYLFSLENQDGSISRETAPTTDINWIVDNLPAGNYTVRVTDANGCFQELTGLLISQPDEGVQIESTELSSFNGFNISCFGAADGFIEVTVAGGSGNYTFEWTGPEGFSSDQLRISNLSPGTYQLTVTDENGCAVNSDELEILSPEPLDLNATISSINGFEISCFGANDGRISLAATGGTENFTISWTGPNNFTSAATEISGLSPGIYEVLLVDENGCEARESFPVNEPDLLEVTLLETEDVLCFGEATGSIAVAVTGGVTDTYVFDWSRDGAAIDMSSQNLENIPAGNYSLSVTDANGCIGILPEIQILQPDAALEATLNQTPVSCFNANDANLSVDITGGEAPYQVSWNIGSTQTEFSGIGPGFYQVTVTDANGCRLVRETTIEDVPVFDVSPEVNQISCNGAADGSILLNLEGGEAPVRAIWDHGPEQSAIYNLGPGTYSVLLEDAKGCTIQRSFNIVEPDILVVVEQIQDALSCEDGQSGAINLIVSGGTPPYNYEWSNGANTAGISGLTNGTYSVDITDQSGCFVSQTFRVNRPTPITIDMVSTTSIECEPRGISETFEINVAGGVAPYTIEWSNGEVFDEGYRMNTDEPGTYAVTVTDGYGCTQNKSFDVENSQVLVDGDYISASFDSYGEDLVNFDVQFINNSSGNIDSYYWDFGDGNNSLEDSPIHRYQEAGIYEVNLTAYDFWNCSSTTTFEIEILDYFLKVPNVFSPNGDGINDYFFPKFLYIEEISFTIMNKWGEILFHTEEIDSRGWDGSYRGQQSTPGNYVYKLNFTTTDGREFSDTGALMLLK